MIEQRRDIADLRWAAYMLATVLWETTSPTKVERPALDRKGRPLKNRDGTPAMVKEIRWQFTMSPVAEAGKGRGRRYQDPAKVAKAKDGTVRVTERDGDQFSVSTTGVAKATTKGALLGATPGGKESPIYAADDGAELVYYGRGYVQLTWWSNYATAGVAIGRGLDLLFEPELVREPQVAFDILAHGMLTGGSFANGRKLSDYVSGKKCDYVNARRMVNGKDHAEDIAKVARRFEAVLLASLPGDAPDGGR